MNFILFITVILTAVVLVVGAYVVAKLVGPRSYNPVKGQPFECGIPPVEPLGSLCMWVTISSLSFS